MNKFKYSVILISYNEEEIIYQCISTIKTADPSVQIILSDGGSTDSTISIAEKENIKIINSEPGRGIQCNAGAEYADGDILLFLHSDTYLPQNAFEILDEYFSSKEVNAGTFRLSFDRENPVLSFYSKFTTFDSIFTRFGDQCIVMRKTFFDQLNGFKDWPIFEDVDILKRARKITKIHSFPAYVITSARRFEKTGAVMQQLLNFWFIIQFLLGRPPAELALMYNRKAKTICKIRRLATKRISVPIIDINS